MKLRDLNVEPTPEEIEAILNAEFGGFLDTRNLAIDPELVGVFRGSAVSGTCERSGVVPLLVEGGELVCGVVLRPSAIPKDLLPLLAKMMRLDRFRAGQVALNLFRRDFAAVFGRDPGDYSNSPFLLPSIDL